MCCCLEDLQASIIETLLTTRHFIFKDDYVQVNQEKHAAMVFVWIVICVEPALPRNFTMEMIFGLSQTVDICVLMLSI